MKRKRKRSKREKGKRSTEDKGRRRGVDIERRFIHPADQAAPPGDTKQGAGQTKRGRYRETKRGRYRDPATWRHEARRRADEEGWIDT